MGVEAAQAFESVRRAAQAGDRDRYVAALLAPRAVRADLITLAAFAGDVMKIPALVRDPQIGEIRVQWWRDALEAGLGGGRSGNPVADAFAELMARRELGLEGVSALLDQLVEKLYGTQPASTREFAAAIDRTQGTLFRFADGILGGAPVTESGFEDAVQAYGLMHAALMLPFDLAAGREPLPRQFFEGGTATDWVAAVEALKRKAYGHLAAYRSALGAEQSPHFLALLPVALVEPYFEALSRQGHDPARAIAEISPLKRVWRLGRARQRGWF